MTPPRDLAEIRAELVAAEDGADHDKARELLEEIHDQGVDVWPDEISEQA